MSDSLDLRHAYQQFVETCSDYAIFFIDPAGTIVSWNPGVLQILGYGHEGFVGRPFDVLFTPADRQAGLPSEELRRALANGRADNVRWHVRQDGTQVFVSGVVFPLFEPEGALARFVAVLRDATQRHRMIEALRTSEQQALVANRAKDDFLAAVAHELRTPLNAILGWTRMGLAGSVPPERALERVAGCGDLMTQLVADLLDASRIRSGKLQLDRQMVDVGAVARAAVTQVQHHARTKDIALDVEAETVPRLWGDPVRLLQVVLNLLTNAIKFTPEHGGVLVEVWSDVDTVHLAVTDTGPGIPPEAVNDLFKPFWQVERPPEAGSGLGLGLTIVRQVVEAHGGSVEVRPGGAGTGATFTVTLPLDERASAR